MGKTGYVWEEIFTEHVMTEFHPESPNRLTKIKEYLDANSSNSLVKIPARNATFEELAMIHDQNYINSIEATKGKHVPQDPDTTASPKTWEASIMAAGGTIECVQHIVDKKIANAFAFVRPPGHHAERSHAMGFCFFNNIAIAAEYALKKCGLKRVAIIDFDVHHGNGTQHSFYARQDVFYMSTHRWPFYPGTGNRIERGEGLGKGYTLNVPFTEVTGDDEFRNVYQDVIFPVLKEYKPEIIMVSAGYDAHHDDPLGGLEVSTSSYTWLTEQLNMISKELCDGRLLMVLEGGYNTSTLKECVGEALTVLQK